MLAKIRSAYDYLTETEKKIADRVLFAPHEAVKMTAKELAQACGTVPSAVVRFCRSVGAQGFSDFKLSLSAQLGRSGHANALLPIAQGDDARQVFQKVFASGVHTLQDTLAGIDFDQAEMVVRLLEKAARVVFFGIGTSSVVATDAQYRLAQLGVPASACTDTLFMNVTAANLRPGDVAVALSHSGSTRATVDAIARAKAAGAVTVAITSFPNSRLAKGCDWRLIAFPDDTNYPVEAVSARGAHFCILDALMMSLAARSQVGLDKLLSRRNEVLKQMRY